MPETIEQTCECCPNVGKLVKFKTMMMCQDCYHKEINLSKESELKADERVAQMNQTIEINQVLKKSSDVLNGLNIQTDIFNAKTVAINELRAAIEADETIKNKPYTLAQAVMAQFEKTKELIFNLNKQIAEIGSEQRAIQVYLNKMANELRAEEREKLKISDINYTPKPVKLTTTKTGTRTIKTRTSKVLDKAALDAAAKELGISASTIQMFVVAKGITIETAVSILKKNIASANKGN